MYGPVYEAYTHFGASAEDAIKAIKAPKGVMTGASLGVVWGPATPGDRENGKPEQKYRDLHFESQGEKHMIELEYIANGSYNTVYGVKDPSIPLILRVSIPPEEKSQNIKLTEAERKAREHEKRLAIEEQLTELQFMRSMGKRGIGPRVYATVLFKDPSMTGVFTEKLEMSLLDAESCPYRTRRAFVDADAESALVDLYARSSRLFECIDTKSPNVLFTPGRPGVDARIAMIDMDPGFCRDAAQSWKNRPTPTITTLDDLEAHLSRRRDSKVLDSACISLLIHCICSMERLHPKHKGNDTASGYGFPYPRVAAHMYNNWPYVWSLVLKHGTMQSGFNAASMVAHYHFANEKQELTSGDCDQSVRTAIARAICAPMTRLLLMTKGRDVHDDRAKDKINIVNIDTRRVMSGDMYVRLARVHYATGGEDKEMRDALNAHDTLGALHTLASRRERLAGRFRCRASTKNGDLVCCHNPGDLFCDNASSVGVRYSDAAYSEPARAKEPKWRDTVSIDPEKTLQQLDSYETARFLCDQMNDIAKKKKTTHYSIARKVFKRTNWTGLDLARMVDTPANTPVDTPSEMLEGLMRRGAPPGLAERLVRRIKWYIEEGKTIGTIGPCAPHF
jgi:hypothetical protein